MQNKKKQKEVGEIRLKSKDYKEMWVWCVLPGHMVDDGGEVGGSIELNWLQALVVGFHHTINTGTVRVLGVSILERNNKVTNLRGLQLGNTGMSHVFLKVEASRLNQSLLCKTLFYVSHPSIHFTATYPWSSLETWNPGEKPRHQSLQQHFPGRSQSVPSPKKIHSPPASSGFA